MGEQDCVDGSCKKDTICKFVCTCLDKCGTNKTKGVNFTTCRDQLNGCFKESPTTGYGHLQCWRDTCDRFYKGIGASREKGEDSWATLGGWMLFGKPLPGVQPARPTIPVASAVGLASLLLAGLVFMRVSSLCSGPKRRQQDLHLQCIDPSAAEDDVAQ